MTTKTYTLAAVAQQLKMSPKVARAKFRRLTDDRPFDHTKVKALNAKQVAATKTFLKADHRVAG